MPERTSAPARPAAPPAAALATAAAVLCLGCWAAVALAGPSAAVPALGPGRLPLDLGRSPSSELVTALSGLSVLAGGTALLAAVHAVGRGWQPRRFLLVGLAGALLTVLLPPVGSADHLSYAAYGRIAALGGDPYAQPPDTFAGGEDPVASAVRDPWRSTTSVYGPVAALLQALASLAGGDSVRATVWCWQLLLLAAWAAAGLGVRAAVREPARRARAQVLWSANPLLLTVGLGGAHADVLAGAAAVGVLLLGRRHPLAAGVALAVAVGTKLPYGAVGAGLLVAALTTGELRRGWVLRGLGGLLLVLVPAHAWAGVHVYDQTRTASRYVSLATVWRPLVDAGLPRGWLLPGMLLVMAAVVLLWWPALVRGDFGDRAAGFTAALAAGYLLGAAYELPWYDALLWGPLGLALAVPVLDRLLALRLALLALAYVPGLVDGMSAPVEALTLGYRREVGPWIAWAALLAVLVAGSLSRWRHRPTGW
ncbi:polyprenol phosphomannose-dependent alpha 1,6 mannosyltransferase MptB [Kineococcus sp. SYSU DK006]|uniref:polyprenol phosphomannose-dependent alpha 1,6 mannosyltransferase MptB n=1 Tax=Kineococcus sp. SYSU DK006 TaxID=3383127 RepID=UPI003D7CEA7F